MRHINQEEAFMASLGWHSIKNFSRYIESGERYVLVITKTEYGRFDVPIIAEYIAENHSGKWIDRYGAIIQEYKDDKWLDRYGNEMTYPVLYWKSLGQNPNIFFEYQSRKRNRQ